MYDFITNRGDIRSELLETVRCFLPADTQSEDVIALTFVRSENIAVYIDVNGTRRSFSYPVQKTEDRTECARYELYACKLSLYRALSAQFGKQLPWGSLTGVRPTRLAAKMVQSGVALRDVAVRMREEYDVSPAKAALTSRILEVQRRHTDERMGLVRDPSGAGNDLANLYVHIPFCPSRCAYCSFVSEGVEKKNWLLLPYVEALTEEIRRTKRWMEECGKRVFSVYVGGGTPTVLPPELLYKVLSAASVDGVEYTCEAGRPDSITREKLQTLAACGVNRVSINPQTLHDKTLRQIGRAHTVAQFFEAYEAANDFGFVKNVDLIAGLEEETEKDFAYTLDGVLSLRPENITVHTLCRKRGSAAAQEEARYNRNTARMVDYSVSALCDAGYEPYYLYRQKQMTANLENIGWCRSGFLCVNNVTVMEETLPVFACGAGAIAKALTPSGKIVRHANPKDVLLYLREFEDRMYKKELFYQNIN